MDLSLKQLEVFIEIAKCENVTQASQKLFLSQAAASMALNEFEKSLGEPCFDRSGKRLLLNEKGKTLLPEAIEAWEKVNDLENRFKKGQPTQAKIRIGASTTIGNYFLPKGLKYFLHHFPHIEIQLIIENSLSICERIHQFDLDFAFIEDHLTIPEFKWHRWRKDRMVIFSSPEHPLANKTKMNKRELFKHPWIFREKGSGTRSFFEHALGKDKNNIPILLELSNTEAIIQAVTENLGLGCVSRLALKQRLLHGDLKTLPTPFWDMDRNLYLIHHKKKYLTDNLKSILDYWGRFSLTQ